MEITKEMKKDAIALFKLKKKVRKQSRRYYGLWRSYFLYSD